MNKQQLEARIWASASMREIAKLFSAASLSDTPTKSGTIYVDSAWALPSTASGSGTFYNCRAIVGGNGTAYSSSAYGYARMVIDRAGQAGCLTTR